VKLLHNNLPGDKWLQNVILGTDFGDRALQITTIENGYKIGNNANNEISFVLEVDTADFSSLYVKRSFGSSELQATDCVWLNSESVNWYGGPEQMDQKYPVQSFNFVDYAYITKELHSAAIMERYWLSSSGFFILVDYDTPLFIDQNNLREDHICFTAKKILPYDIHKSTFTFNYRIGAGSNARVAHKNVITRMLGHPRGLPEERMIRYPIWNTWVRYQRNINENTIRSFANEIVANDFKYSLLDIDDFWEDCYGSLTVNQTNFGNLRDVTTELHELGFIVGMWVHPFVNKDCATFAYATEMNLLVKSHNGSTDTSWWNSRTNQAAHVDFTNPQAMSWFKSRLEAIQRDYGVDIFKFDAGETSWFPEDPVLNGNSDLSPSLITQSFVSMAADFGTQLEIRTGWGTQHLRVFVRMLDFDSRWTADNGLKSLIPTLLQFNLNGYVFVLPDMIGGNQYGDDTITSELFIRWLQASVFMPALQFSVAPWDFDAETITISRQFTELHASYADLIIERFNLAVSDGEPGKFCLSFDEFKTDFVV